MAKKSDGSTKVTALRRQAEDLLRATKRDVAALPVKDVYQLVHEIQVQQVELEMQNEELRRTQMELGAARDRYADLYDFSPAGHLTLDASGTVVEANLRAGMLLGLNRTELIGQSLARFVASNDQDILHRHCQEVLKTGTRQTCEVHLRKGSGASNCLYLESLADLGEPGHITRWRMALLDISDRKRDQQSLRESEGRLQSMLDHSPSSIFMKDLQGRYVDVNTQFEQTFHLTRQDVIGKTDHDVFPPKYAAAYRDNDLQVLKAGRSIQFEEVALHDDGLHTNVVWKFPLRRLDGTLYAICGIVTDITERKQAEEALHQKQRELQNSQAQLQDLTAKLFTAQDSERQRIARDLHDDFSQRLAALVLDVSSLQRHPPLLPELIGKALEPVREELKQLSDDLHNLAYRLHPSLLRHAGLQAAIEDHIHKAIERTGLHIILKVNNLPGEVPLDGSTCLFRVFQESLQNVVKHANATEVLVKLSGSSKGVGLSVIDNGKGFDVSEKSGHQKGLGLISMQERLRLMNGFLNIHSRPSDGTKVCAWLPSREQKR